MIIEKEIVTTQVVKVEVNPKDLIDNICSQKEAMDIILTIDSTIESWPFTIELVKNLLEFVNDYKKEICELEKATPEFVAQLKLAMGNFVGESK